MTYLAGGICDSQMNEQNAWKTDDANVDNKLAKSSIGTSENNQHCNGKTCHVFIGNSC